MDLGREPEDGAVGVDRELVGAAVPLGHGVGLEVAGTDVDGDRPEVRAGRGRRRPRGREPRVLTLRASTSSRSIVMLAMLRVRRTRPPLAATPRISAAVAAVEGQRVGVALALDGVVGVARVPVEVVVAAAQQRDVVALVAVDAVVAAAAEERLGAGAADQRVVARAAVDADLLVLDGGGASLTRSSPPPAVIATTVKVALSNVKSAVPSAPTSPPGCPACALRGGAHRSRRRPRSSASPPGRE